MRVLFVKQDHASPNGFVGDAFTSLGYDVTEFTVVPEERYGDPNVSVRFPDPRDYDAVVPFGAAWSVYDENAIGNWIGDEIAFTREAIAAGVPVLGICFGGQVLAAALGGEVSRAPEPEIGWYDIDSDAPELIDPGPWFEWHYDRFEIPAGVRVLARTARATQAFVVGRSLGLQFHPELNAEVLEAWLDGSGARQLAASGVDAGEVMARTKALQAAAGRRTRELIHRFVRDVAIAPADATILTPRLPL
jgi:GMP synthase-like glutamine amidotransferase